MTDAGIRNTETQVRHSILCPDGQRLRLEMGENGEMLYLTIASGDDQFNATIELSDREAGLLSTLLAYSPDFIFEKKRAADPIDLSYTAV